MQAIITQESKLFNLHEARELIPLIKTITYKHQQQLAPIQDKLNRMLSNDPRRNLIEESFEEVVAAWKSKIEKLGANVYGLWIVEFNVGEGVLCWKFPELDITYFRWQGNNFSSRIRLDDFIEEQDPDWAV